MAERVLVTGARSAAALDLARDFAAAGYEAHLADSSVARIARWSRTPHAVHRLPPPRQQPALFAAALCDLVTRLDPCLVIPSCEEVFHLARPSLGQLLGGRLFAPDLGLLRTLHHKHLFAGLCERIGLPIPETHLIECHEDLARFAHESEDRVFKPAWSRFGARALIGPGPEALAGIAPSAEAPWVVQRRVRGREYSFYAAAHAGRLVAFAAYGAGWRLDGGASFAFEAVAAPLAAKLRAIAAHLANGTALTGQFSCDLIVDADDAPWLLECNPRATSGVHLLTGTGALARAIRDPSAPFAPARASPRYVLAVLLTYGLAQALTRRRWREWRETIGRGSDVIGTPGDRLPVFGALADGIEFALRGWQSGVSTTEATTRDIEWNGEEFA